ncbi:uncharacterized protein CANTADRAFT_49967 [Suhomyces tanzawaensis NRRL Y-17324]|uniref:Very-long-chain (3R)-3-hydroxyacyl-CoA dehydratase n=1 Tax=Suhomyces tanzawaensis NRRL Y-17324 TaxID=984487 RepID=A0A1E4SKS7_9ASCO|nr:uncharacterized protein CANTADRAFT_49967 [Suhomyces tanzawaensis NRRL Y-17324]ODV80032.1 hypothetical protein CANTADRAFT_49967 [Suhomyces tanzawaensis NRRL Y-17324]
MPRYTLPTHLKFVFFWNTAAATLWFCCLGRFAILLPLVGRKFLPGGIADFFHVVSMIPLVSFFMQKTLVKTQLSVNDLWNLFNGSRMVWVCYGVIFPHPKVAKHTSYSFLILSWCLMNFIHFSFHAFRIRARGSTPHFLFWLQYHNFYLTFPIALISEMILTFLSLGFVDDSLHYQLLIKVVLLSYVPVAYFTWRYLKQRKSSKYDAVIAKRLQSRARSVGASSATATSSNISPENHELAEMSASSHLELQS